MSAEAGISKWRQGFLVLQFGLSVFILVVAALFVRGLKHASALDPGFDAERLVVFPLEPRQHGYLGDDLAAFMTAFSSQIEGLPGVASVAYARLRPLSSHRTSTRVYHVDDALNVSPPIRVHYNLAGSQYFQVMGLTMKAGRGFQAGDFLPLQRVCVVNETFARRHFKDKDPLGEYLFYSNADEGFLVIGVVSDSKYYALGEPPRPYLYLPMANIFGHEAAFLIRAQGDPAQLTSAVQAFVREQYPGLIANDIQPASTVLAAALEPAKLAAKVSFSLGGLAFFLGMIGIIGLIAYAIELRRCEIGVRLALGAQPNRLVALLVKNGLVLVVLGLVLGLLAAAGVTPFLKPMLNGIHPRDPFAFWLPAVFLFLVALVSMFIPAQRAASREPMAALRYE